MVTAESTIRSDPAYLFDFCGGHLAIDFTNTVGSRGSTPEEHLRTFGDLIAWAEAREVLAPQEVERLKRAAARRPTDAKAALTEALRLREALYRALQAAAAGRRVPEGDLDILNAHAHEVFSRMRLAPGRARLTLAVDPVEAASLAAPILIPVVRAAVELLTSDAIERVRTCADDSCAWLFFDATRNRTRRWCDMKACGNRSKVRRFRAR